MKILSPRTIAILSLLLIIAGGMFLVCYFVGGMGHGIKNFRSHEVAKALPQFGSLERRLKHIVGNWRAGWLLVATGHSCLSRV